MFFISKVVTQLVLMIVFLWYFGLPALQKYQEKNVMVVKTQKSLGGIPAPKVTVCRRMSELKKSWGNGTAVGNYCKDKKDIVKCIEAGTFNQTETVSRAEMGYDTKKPLTDPDIWTEDITYTKYGRCYTLDVKEKITDNYKKHQITFYISKESKKTENGKSEIAYDFYIHDGNFILSGNAFGTPKLYQRVTANEYDYIINLYLVSHHKTHLARCPCEEQPDYSIADCVRRSLATKVGCRLPWDRSTAGYQVCHTMEQYR